MVVPAGTRISDEAVARAMPEIIVLAWTATGARAKTNSRRVSEFIFSGMDVQQAAPALTADAKQLADRHGIEMFNESQLGNLLELVGAKYDAEVLALLRDERKYCPKCESEMVLRTAKKGFKAGSTFWGCSTYPKCQGIIRIG